MKKYDKERRDEIERERNYEQEERERRVENPIRSSVKAIELYNLYNDR